MQQNITFFALKMLQCSTLSWSSKYQNCTYTFLNWILHYYLQTIMHLDTYDNMGKELFLQTLRIMMGELQKRYQQVT